MSDLTRRVLAIVQTDPVVTVCTVPDNQVATLARQVEAVEALADRLDREAEKEREKPNRTLHDYGWDDACTVAAARIRNTLADVEKGNTP